jgi:hypothetical protein
MLDVVTFKWKPKFTAVNVNALFQMVCRHYHQPFRFSVVTDDARGIDQGIRIIPLWDDHATVSSPYGARHPACYRRLKLFAPEARELIGERIVCLDLDVVITASLDDLWDRPEDAVFYKGQWGRISAPQSCNPYNGSMFMLTAGARPQVWQLFDPACSPRVAFRAGYGGSDQAWLAYVLGKYEAVWTREDGVYSFRNDIAPNGYKLPYNARMVMFHGKRNPWDADLRHVEWIRKHYALDNSPTSGSG